ncbi:MAG: hypothetical protein FJW22_01855 [Acidimicrobiia bacterium]|nr:hypothetical protein [Acidimicrobiia bacterium]
MTDAARQILLVILLLGLAGISLELWLLNHVEDAYMLIPLVLNAAAFIAAGLVAMRPSLATVRLFQGVMVLLLISAVLGMWLHFQVNMEFQLEMDPQLSGLALFRKAIVAKTPPAMAPGAMLQLSLIGLAYTFMHPALSREGKR